MKEKVMPTSTIDIVRANFSRRRDIQGELRQIDEAATTDQRDYSEAESARITELRSEMEAVDNRIQANLDEQVRSEQISQGMDQFLGVLADRERGEVHDHRSLGERFVDSDEFRAFADGTRNNPRVEFPGLDYRAVTNTTTAVTSGGAWIRPDRLARTGQDDLDRRVFLTDLLPSVPVGVGAAEYVQDKSPLADMADKAVEVAEGQAKPQAGITAEVVTEPTPTIAAWVNMTRQIASDGPQVRAYLENRLRYSLRRRFDAQVIAGTGSGNIIGLANRSGIVTYAPSSSEAVYRSIRRAIRLGEDAEAVYEIAVLNPADAERFDLSNDAALGLHAVPNVAGPSARTAWGLTQVRSTAIAPGTALLIDPIATSLLDRQAPAAYLTDSHASNFTSNILTLLLEMRAGLALFDPSGVAKVTFNHAAS
jgi:HK97 family phage major capsid protein